jgi:diamine N-acetyltransferase
MVVDNAAYLRVLHTYYGPAGTSVQLVAMSLGFAQRELLDQCVRAQEIRAATRHIVQYHTNISATGPVFSLLAAEKHDGGAAMTMTPIIQTSGPKTPLDNFVSSDPLKLLLSYTPPVYDYDYVALRTVDDVALADDEPRLPFPPSWIYENAEFSLAPVTAQNMERCLELVVAPDQDQFVGSVGEALAYAHYYPQDTPLALMHFDQIIGFAMYSALDPPSRRNILFAVRVTIERFLIDANHQGHGYGRSLLALLVQYLVARYTPHALSRKLPLVLVLNVIETNAVALALYRRAGFVEYDREVAARRHVRMYYSPQRLDLADELRRWFVREAQEDAATI